MSDETLTKPRAYPLPQTEDDPRFNLGLSIDVAKVLAEHGYPEITSGRDIVELQLALFGFIYEKGGSGEYAGESFPG